MSALEEVLHGIDRCLHRIGDAKSALARALVALEEAGAPGGLGVLLGSRDPEA
ncbi:hypothetical protein OOZ19_10955 [Saccharopolyspora sp. NFXS83]|uniref:hypothetical protein n=1 Tax=Saccharopolyspora sp. NFXS83 TaxID=2993560 RepID=UPI00224A4BE4|nr:hypothetical protein [Saccharopolyspora sp. NFXS83]MCX2730761.1 hypothetical protein [Saccharopolyspora sp. NFXS83]